MMSYTLRRYTIGTNCDSSINSFLNINHLSGSNQGQKEIAACAESRFFPLFATNFMYSLMYILLKIAVSRFLGKIIAIFFCPWFQ